MEQAVRLIYFLAESPDQLCSRLLQRSARLLLEQITEGGEPDQSRLQEGASQVSEEQGTDTFLKFTLQIIMYSDTHKCSRT